MRATFAAVAAMGVLVLAGCGATEPGTRRPADSGSPAAAPGGPAAPSAAGTAAGAPSAAAALPVGPGPQEHYTVQAQPAPGSCHYRTEHGEPLPDLACTPGAVSPAVTQDNLARTICKSGYTATIRPSSYVTGKEKKANALSYGYTGSLSDAEYDHQVSLELGGDPNDPRNLWVEPADPGHKAGTGVNNRKDPVETKLHTAVCKGTITLAQAQSAIATDWTTALADLGLG